MIPELPSANYRVVRDAGGYGIVDSTTVQLGTPAAADVQGEIPRETPQEAAIVYPGNYWMSLLEPPAQRSSRNGSPAKSSARRWCRRTTTSLAEVGLQLLSSSSAKGSRSVDHVLKAKPS